MNVKAHEWFPLSCCGGQDCKEITEWKEFGPDSWYIKNQDGAYVVSKKFDMKPSQDGKQYMCVYQQKVICIFTNSGV